MQISGYAFEHLEIDVLGGDLQRSKRGNKYVLTLSCRSSGWPFAIPMRNVRSKTITDKLSELFCSIGIQKNSGIRQHAFIQVRVICEVGK